MKRAFTVINFVGVLALAALCVAQWQRDRRLNLDVNRLERARQHQTTAFTEQSNSLRGVTEDLQRFKERFATAHADLRDAQSELRRKERENQQLAAERDQLKESVTNWAAAVTERDARLKQSSELARELALKLNDSVVRFNELATNYNASVRRFNELATNYNNVVGQLNEVRQKETATAGK